jgi:periplasmic protein TonB
MKTLINIITALVVGVSAFAETPPAFEQKALAEYAPRPQYPLEARSRHITGAGVFILTVNPEHGGVTKVRIARSTGSSVLDNAAMSALRQWRFTAGIVSKVNITITFTMTGAHY